MEFLLPVFLKLFPEMLPSTFETESKKVGIKGSLNHSWPSCTPHCKPEHEAGVLEIFSDVSICNRGSEPSSMSLLHITLQINLRNSGGVWLAV